MGAAAVQDLKEIFDYISLESSRTAGEFIKKLVEQAEKLARFPQLGRLIPEMGESRYRELVYGNYRLFHEVRPKEILIFSILHSKRLFSN